MEPTLFQRLLGARFYALPPAVRALLGAPAGWRHAGSASVQRARNPLARACGWLLALPPASVDNPLQLLRTADGAHEIWQARLGRGVFDIRMRADGRRLQVRRRGLRTWWVLHVHESRLWAHPERVRWLGVPVPRLLLAGVQVQAADVTGTGAAPRCRVRIEIVLPLAGRVAGIDGWLQRAESDAPA